ncbi:MAG: methyltransferase domain-containing protein [Arcobacter sp.]|uniref:methyltransferase domain-containing protein n=1 Tax=Arcobacter sp. TaxID=1872629 RepID=UPI003AFF7D27
MRINNKDTGFLNGNNYLNSLDFKLNLEESDFLYLSKIDFLENLVVDKDIIHVGCVDHNIESIEKKISKNKWLHKILDENSNKCIGVDIKEEEIKILGSKYGFDVHSIDITKKNEILENKKFDYLLLPDVLEHIGSPVDFLTKLRDSHKENINKIVITVPNAFNHRVFNMAAKNIEVINTDHRYWFTPYTILKVLFDSGFKVEQLKTYDKASKEKRMWVRKLKSIPLYRLIRKLFYNETFFTKGGIIVIASFK